MENKIIINNDQAMYKLLGAIIASALYDYMTCNCKQLSKSEMAKLTAEQNSKACISFKNFGTAEYFLFGSQILSQLNLDPYYLCNRWLIHNKHKKTNGAYYKRLKIINKKKEFI